MKSLLALYSCLAVALPSALACDSAMVLRMVVHVRNVRRMHPVSRMHCGTKLSFGMGSIELLCTVYELQIPSSIAPLLAEEQPSLFLQV